MPSWCWRRSASDSAHPAFSKMFVETEISPNSNAIFAQRQQARARRAGHRGGAFRHRPFRRRRATRRPRPTAAPSSAAAAPSPTPPPSIRARGLAAIDGFVLDPVIALRRRVRVPANKKVALTFWTVVGADARRGRGGDRAARPPRELRAPGHAVLDALAGADAPCRPEPGRRRERSEARALSDLSRSVSARCRPKRSPPGLGRQSALWPMAISGDFPIFALRIGDVADLEIVAQALRYQEYLRARGLSPISSSSTSRPPPTCRTCSRRSKRCARTAACAASELGPRQHIFAVRRDLMDEDSYRTLLAAARIVLHTRNGTIFDQIERAEAAALQARDARTPAQAIAAEAARRHRPPASPQPAEPPAAPPTAPGSNLWNGFGGFDRGRPRLCRPADRQPHDAAALDQRHLQCAPSASTPPPKARPSPGAATAATSS